MTVYNKNRYIAGLDPSMLSYKFIINHWSNNQIYGQTNGTDIRLIDIYNSYHVSYTVSFFYRLSMQSKIHALIYLYKFLTNIILILDNFIPFNARSIIK